MDTTLTRLGYIARGVPAEHAAQRLGGNKRLAAQPPASVPSRWPPASGKLAKQAVTREVAP